MFDEYQYGRPGFVTSSPRKVRGRSRLKESVSKGDRPLAAGNHSTCTDSTEYKRKSFCTLQPANSEGYNEDLDFVLAKS